MSIRRKALPIDTPLQLRTNILAYPTTSSSSLVKQQVEVRILEPIQTSSEDDCLSKAAASPRVNLRSDCSTVRSPIITSSTLQLANTPYLPPYTELAENPASTLASGDPGSAKQHEIAWNDSFAHLNACDRVHTAERDVLEEVEVNKKSKVVSAFEDASIFLGGLLKHPTESTKHFTILRHSHGLVYYRGPSTSITITVFADRPLPPDRRYWFQTKGWTGQTGMRVKALLRTNESWINVTPTKRARREELPPMDERAWQRDIKKFLDKAPRALQKHLIRETAILRVPSEAVDGYFRIVLTCADNKSPLCPSPVFRVASTSMSASSLKGASLSTLPLELSINILQHAATTVATNFVGPFAATVKNRMASAMPAAVSRYGQTAYTVSGAAERLDYLDEQVSERREERVVHTPKGGSQYVPMSRPQLVGDSEGPDTPFPVQIDSKIVQGSGVGQREVGVPTANLDDVPAEIIATLDGVYFGWAFVKPKDKAERERHLEWHQAIISITYDHTRTSVATKKVVRAYLLHDFAGEQFIGARISLVVMGDLRPIISYENKEVFFRETIRDISITRSSLERECWGPATTLHRIQIAKSERSLRDRYVDGRLAVQRRIDSVPIHRLGIRNESFGLHDRGLYGNGGLYVVRDTL